MCTLLVMQTETLGMEFANFGKSFIVSNNLSPDALVQVAYVASETPTRTCVPSTNVLVCLPGFKSHTTTCTAS